MDYFPQNLGAVSEEQGERFHQDIKGMERRYQGRWNVNMMADYSCMLHREDPRIAYKRQSGKRSIQRKGEKSTKDIWIQEVLNNRNCCNYYNLYLI